MRLQFVDSAIAEDFNSFYSISIANNLSDQSAIFRLRHDVFCVEYGYDMKTVEGLESDAFDTSSIQVLLRRRDSEDAIGCFRYIQSTPSAENWLPICTSAAEYLHDPRYLATVDPHSAAEISRFTIRGDIRAGRSGGLPATAADPYLAVGMFHAMAALIQAERCNNAFVVIEPRLARLTSRFGIVLDQISPVFDHYGRRAAFVTNCNRVDEETRAYRPGLRELYQAVARSITPHVDHAAVA